MTSRVILAALFCAAVSAPSSLSAVGQEGGPAAAAVTPSLGIVSDGHLGPAKQYFFDNYGVQYYINSDNGVFYSQYSNYPFEVMPSPAKRYVAQANGPEILVLDFTDFVISTPSSRITIMGSRPVAIATTGDVSISGGTIKVLANGGAGGTAAEGYVGSGVSGTSAPGALVANGGAGGQGVARVVSPASTPWGWDVGSAGGGGGGGSSAKGANGLDGASTTGQIYQLTGGAGGAAQPGPDVLAGGGGGGQGGYSQAWGNDSGGPGGNGGGALMVVAGGNFVVTSTGTINADGADGGYYTAYAGGGGGGGGGYLRFSAGGSWQNDGAISARGGSGTICCPPSGYPKATDPSHGGIGSGGRVVIAQAAGIKNNGTLDVSGARNGVVQLPPAVTVDKTSLGFGAVTTGAAFTSHTPAQTVRFAQTGAGTVTWTAASTAPWLTVSPASGTGPATLTISTQFASGLTASQTGRVNLTVTGGGSAVGPIDVTLRVAPATAPLSAPFGVVDTPVGDATVLAGSIAVTGWTLDNIGVQRVELWRDLQPGETTAPFASTPSDPRHGKVFIANATFVEGARPDVETMNPTAPFSSRAGWGYLLLSRGLWNQGNGTYKLYAFAVDQENNLASIGTKTVVVSNDTATKPFGSIDTPSIGGEATGPNFGWALTPKVNGVATCKIRSTGVQVSIDSGPLQPVTYGDARPDIAGAFPGFSNTDAAGGHFIFDWSTLSNGSHTIGWLVTDDCNRSDGIGSRFFNVTNGASQIARPDPDFRLTTEASSDAEFRLKAETTGIKATDVLPNSVVSAFRRNSPEQETVLLARGYGELPEIVTPDEAGTRTIELKQGERIEVRLPSRFDTAYQLVNGQRRPLPPGSTWDDASGIFYWQPAPGFFGRYGIAFSNGNREISISVVIVP